MEIFRKKLLEAGYTEEQVDAIISVSKESMLIPKYRLDEINEKKKYLEEQIENYNKQIEELKKGNAENETLKSQIQEMKNENKRLIEEQNLKMVEFYRTNAIRDAIGKDVYDVDYIMTKLDKDKIVFDTDNKKILAGLTEQIEAFKNDDILKRQFVSFEGNKDSIKGYIPQNSDGNQNEPQKQESLQEQYARSMFQKGD